MRLLGLLFAAIGGALIGFLLGLGVANAAPRGGSDMEGSPALLGASMPAQPSARVPTGSVGRAAVQLGVPDLSANVGAPLLRGTATWYCSPTSACTRGYQPSDLVAAIDPTLGIPKGTWLRVWHGSRSGPQCDVGCVEVRVVDVCACPGARVIDLTSGAFLRLAPLSRGVIAVSLSDVGPRATLPPTDTRYEP